MPFFDYVQNNSGGWFTDAEGKLTEHVVIEAVDVNHANMIAEQIGIYFDGCEEGFDCPCCGDRWSRAQKGDGTEAPIRYNVPLNDYYNPESEYNKKLDANDKCGILTALTRKGWGVSEKGDSVVYYLNGIREWYSYGKAPLVEHAENQ